MKKNLGNSLLFLSFLFSLFLCACDSGSDDLNRNQEDVSSDESVTWQKVTSDVPVEPHLTKSGDEVIFSLQGFYLGKMTINGQLYSRIILPGHSPLTNAGYPELPKVRTNILLPQNAEVNPIVVDTRYHDIPIYAPIPSRGNITRDVDPATVPYVPNAFYITGQKYPETQFVTDETFILRDHRGLPLQFQPFIYLRAQKKLRVYTSIKVKLNITSDVPHSGHVPSSPAFADIYASTFLNFSEVNPFYAAPHEPGRMIIITADAYAAAAATLAEWKNQRGLPTEVVEVSKIGTTAESIKAFIKEKYEEPDSLTYVILVGDSDTIPTLRGAYERAHSDPLYAMVAGNDLYPDLFISRISVRSLEQAEAQVEKFIRYERDPDTGDAADWYLRAIGVASNQSGGPDKLIDWQRADELRKALEGYGYTSVAKIYDPKAKKEDLIAAINSGASIYNYIGHGSGTSWSTTDFAVSDLSKLTNGSKLPLIIDVACLNGSFVDNQTSLAEGMLRAGTKENPAGAIAMYAASTSAAWYPPTVMQSHIVKDLYVKELKYSVGSLLFGGGMKVVDDFPGSEGKQLIEQYNIFGDASLMVRTKPPTAIKVEHPTNVPAAGKLEVVVKSENGQPMPNAAVTLYNQEMVATTLTNSDGIATLSYDNAGSRFAKITVVGFNLVPYIKELPIVGTAENRRPVAKVGKDQIVKAGMLVTLDGSKSKDPDGDLITFQWTQKEGPKVTLSDATSAKPTFTAQEVEAETNLVFELVVNDGKMDSDPVLTTVTIKGPEFEVVKESTDTPIDIPDDNKTGITSTITLDEGSTINGVEVDVDITHSFIGDLIIKLECPQGTSVTLHNKDGGSADNINKTYAVENCNGTSGKGVWKLVVSDVSHSDKGKLNKWKLTVRMAKLAPTDN